MEERHGGGPSPAVAAPATAPLVTKDTILTFSYYQLFGLPDPVLQRNTTVTRSAIDVTALTRAYRRFSLLFHPDKDDSAEARRAFDYVKTALETLVDEEKRNQYDAERRSVGEASSGDAGEQRRQRQADEDADWAAQILKMKETQRAAAEAERQRNALEKEEAMRRMTAELTSSLDTPFAMMEGKVLRDWDVDEELLAMKLKDVAKLMKELGAVDDGGGGAEKRQRCEEA